MEGLARQDVGSVEPRPAHRVVEWGVVEPGAVEWARQNLGLMEVREPEHRALELDRSRRRRSELWTRVRGGGSGVWLVRAEEASEIRHGGSVAPSRRSE